MAAVEPGSFGLSEVVGRRGEAPRSKPLTVLACRRGRGAFPVTESVYPEAPTQEVIRTDLQSVFRAAVEFTLEAVLEQHIREIVGADKWKRAQKGRRATRNGTYLRRLLTSVGLLNVAVPRTRENGSACDVIGRYERRSDEINDAIVSAYLHGVSTRNMRKVTDALIGEDVSRSTV